MLLLLLVLLLAPCLPASQSSPLYYVVHPLAVIELKSSPSTTRTRLSALCCAVCLVFKVSKLINIILSQSIYWTKVLMPLATPNTAFIPSSQCQIPSLLYSISRIIELNIHLPRTALLHIKSHYSPPPARMVLPRGFYKMTIENLNGISGEIIITSKSWSIISSPPPPPHLASSIRVWHLNHHLLCFSFKLFQYLMRVCFYACEHSLLFKAPNCLFRNHSPPSIARIEIRTWFPPVFGYKLIWGFVSGCWNPPCGDLVVIKYTSHEHVWHDENPPWCILWRDDDDDSSDRIERKGGGRQ